MFHDLELADDCEEVIDRFPSVVDTLKTNAYKTETTKIKMGTKSLGKGKSSKVNSGTTASQSNCSSIQPLHSIRENGEESDMEEQVPELVDISILFFYISKTLEMIRISFMASLLNAVL